jgi:hydroxyacylglutathione hydrolase
VILEKSMHPGWLSNTWLLAAGPGRDAVLIDAGAPPGPLLETIQREGLRPRQILLTHHHIDHVCEAAAYGHLGVEVCAHASERDRIPACQRTLEDGEVLEVDGLQIRTLHIPGHTCGQLAFHVTGEGLGDGPPLVFTGDTLFKGSIGGTRGPAHTTFADIRHSIQDVLLALPPETRVLPGHTEPTTVGAERETNPFARAFQGLDPLLEQPCTVAGEPATLLVWAGDYDGGYKAWVRFPDGREDTVAGSQVRR